MTTRTKSKAHPHAALPDAGNGSLISEARLVELYAVMLRCRMLRERIRGLSGLSKSHASASGSEAVVAAAIIGLLPQDSIICSSPQVCAAMLKGVPLESILRPLRAGSSRIRPDIRAYQSYIARGVFAASGEAAGPANLALGALAAGAALAAKRCGRGTVAVAFYVSATAKEAWRSSFDFAVANELPLIFVRQAAGQLQPVRRGGKPSGRSTAASPGSLPIIPVDSNDAVAVYRVAHEAIAHARRGSGPTLIDCVPVRLAGERRQDSDCIARMERYLEAKGLHPERVQADVAAKFTRALDAAVTAARTHPRAKRRVRRSGKAGK